MKKPFQRLRGTIRILCAVAFVASAVCDVEAAAAEAPTRQRIKFPDARIGVNGLPWFEQDKPVLRRLPARSKDTFRAAVWSLAQHPSGGRLRFRTDALTIGIVAKNPDTTSMPHMTSIGQSGFDIYVGEDFLGSAAPDKDGRIVKEWTVGKSNALRDITIYLPLYKGVTIEEITLDPKARLELPKPFAVKKPVVYYGSSITQGGCASNPGMSFPAILGRWTDSDFVNLGFSGSGLGDTSVAVAMTEIDSACYVLDYWANPTASQFQATLPGFVDVLRKKHPKAPIIIPGPFYNTGEALEMGFAKEQMEKRKIARDFVEQRQKAGDLFIAYVDGFDLLWKDQAGGLVDGRHCNSLGFYFIARGLEPHLRRAMGLPPR